MGSSRTRTCLAAFAVMLTVVGASSADAENLGDVLRESGYDRLIGTWLDKDTKGAAIKTTYAWRFENRVVEATAKTSERETVALMGLNAKTGDIYHMGADNQGGGSIGKWVLKDGDAILELGFVTGEGQEGVLRIRHHFEDDDTLAVTIEGPKAIIITMVRAKE